jgi:enoyl-CoA hydratase
MEHGKVNAIDLEMFAEFSERLSEVERSSATAIILTGTGKTFSAGVNLFRVLEGGRPYLEKFLPLLVQVFERLFLFPKPVIAAVNGHAIAGGCILTCASDYRIASKGEAKIGVSELLVGVPFPPLALEVMRFGVRSTSLQEVVYTGTTYPFEQALQRGMIDEIVASDELIPRALQVASGLGSLPPRAFVLTKRELRLPFVENARRFGAEDQQILNDWAAPSTLEIIRSYLQKTIGKSSPQSHKE